MEKAFKIKTERLELYFLEHLMGQLKNYIYKYI